MRLSVTILAISSMPLALASVSQKAVQGRFLQGGLQVGDPVCITGWVVDNFCIDRNEFLDAPESPFDAADNHSYHCMFDVDSCIDSGFQVMGDKELNENDSNQYCQGFQIDDTDALVEAGRALGSSETCNSCGNGEADAPTHGFRVTVKGTVSDLGDGSAGTSGVPTLAVTEILDSSMGCDEGELVVPPMCRALGPENMPVTDPEPVPISVSPEELQVGDSVCITGWVVDNFCIDRDEFLDAPESPFDAADNHSYHCMFDVDQCIASGFQVMGDKELNENDSSKYCQGFQIEDTDGIVAAGRELGSSETCTNCVNADESAPTHGFRVTVKGTVSDLGDGSTGSTGVPTLTDTEILDSTEECGAELVVPPMCRATGPATMPVTETTSTMATMATMPATEHVHEDGELHVGDPVCFTGWVVDNFCIDRNEFLDAPESPFDAADNHSYHCMFDVDQCIESGFQVMGDKEINEHDSGKYCQGYQIDDTDGLVAAGRAMGSTETCTSCGNEDAEAPTHGFRVTVKGTVSDLGDGSTGSSGVPTLAVTEILDGSVECGDELVIPPMCADHHEGDGHAHSDDETVEEVPEDQDSSASGSYFNLFTLVVGIYLSFHVAN